MKNRILISVLATMVVTGSLSLHGCKKEEPTVSFELWETGKCDLIVSNHTKDDIAYLPYSIEVQRWSPAGKEMDSLKLGLNVLVDRPIAVLPGQVAIESYSTISADIGPKNAGEKWAITAEIDWKKGIKQREIGWKILGGGDWNPIKDQAQ